MAKKETKKKAAKKEKKVVVQDRTKGSVEHAKLLDRYNELAEQIRRDISEIGGRFYSLGCAWKVIRDDRLWKAAEFKSFQDYCEQEIHQAGKGPTRQTVYNCISVAESLTREQALRLGPSLSYAVVKEGDKVQKEVMRLVTDGVSTTEVMRGLRQKKEAEKAESAKADKKEAKLAITHHNGGLTTDNPTASRSASKSSKPKPAKAPKPRDVEKGQTKLAATKGNAKKAGWTKQAVVEIGGLEVTIEINPKKGLLRFTAV